MLHGIFGTRPMSSLGNRHQSKNKHAREPTASVEGHHPVAAPGTRAEALPSFSSDSRVMLSCLFILRPSCILRQAGWKEKEGDQLFDLHVQGLKGRVFEAWRSSPAHSSGVAASGLELHVGAGRAQPYQLCLYASMQNDTLTPPNHVTFVTLLQAFAAAGDLPHGRQLHAQNLAREMESHMILGNNLVDMYAKCGSLEDARRVFDRLMNRDVVTWTAMIAAYVQHGSSH